MNEHIDVRPGQIWRRKRDGKLVRITKYDAYWQDARWVGHSFKGKGVIWAWNLDNLYELVEEGS